MKIVPIVPASTDFDADGVPRSQGDAYHPRVGAAAQAQQVFLAGNDLPTRWQGRVQFTVLETGFGLGNNFLATWDAWRADPRRCDRLSFVSIEAHPLSRDALVAVHRGSLFDALARHLIAAWPPLTPNLHRLSFDDGRVELLLALGDVQAWLPELRLSADAFYLDDGFAPARNPRMWNARVCKALGRLAAPGATLASSTATQTVRADLTSAGFEVRLADGIGGDRDITLGRHSPTFVPRRPPGGSTTAPSTDRRALIVGGGLAGAATAWALAERGWHSVVVERRSTLAAEASGNPAGIFHGTLNAQDGPHARLHRAAALAAGVAVRLAVDAHAAAGAVDGLLRLESGRTLAEMQSMLALLGVPVDYAQAVDAETASRLAGVPLARPAWHYPGGGWVHPAGLVRSFIERARHRVTLRCGVEVRTIRSVAGRWQLLDPTGCVIDEAGTLVLANAGDALRLLDAPVWPMGPVRGQISLLPVSGAPVGLAACRLPVAGAGYLLPAADGQLVFGATSQPGDADPAVRKADHAQNLAQFGRLTALALTLDPRGLSGRTAWRWVTADRLPLIGAVPVRALWQGHHEQVPRWDQPRCVPREPGLFVFSGLASRGIGWSALGGQGVAAAITGTPWPIESSLVDAVDPARFISRAQRLRSAGPHRGHAQGVGTACAGASAAAVCGSTASS